MVDFSDIPEDQNINQTILDIDTSDAVEPKCVESGEYLLRITGLPKDSNGNIVQLSQNGNKYFRVSFDIPSEPCSKGVGGFFMVPDPSSMDAKQLNNAKWNLEIFKRAFGLTEINFNNMIGKEGWAMVKLVPEGDYPEKNEVSKYIAGASSGQDFDVF